MRQDFLLARGRGRLDLSLKKLLESYCPFSSIRRIYPKRFVRFEVLERFTMRWDIGNRKPYAAECRLDRRKSEALIQRRKHHGAGTLKQCAAFLMGHSAQRSHARFRFKSTERQHQWP